MNLIEMTLSHTAEECSELTKACIKAQRFGLDIYNTKEGKTNRECIEEEANDILGQIHLMHDLGIINVDISKWQPSVEKLGKRAEAYQLSLQLGCLSSLKP